MAEEGDAVAKRYPHLKENVAILWRVGTIAGIAKRLSDHYRVPVSHKQVWNARPLDSDEGQAEKD